MLNFFKKKKKEINTDLVNNFNNALKVIEDFVVVEDFEKALIWLEEIRKKEDESFKSFIENVKEEQKKKEIEIFTKKISKIDKLKDEIEKKKKIYDINLEKKRKIIETKQIQKKVDELIWNKKFSDASVLLNVLLEKNKEDTKIINYINQKKKILLKIIEKEKNKRLKEIQKDASLEAKSLIWELKDEIELENLDKNKNFFSKFFSKFDFKKKKKERRLIDEVEILLKSHDSQNEILAKSKLEEIHSWFAKEISGEKINWFELYWKILWADKISWDAIWFMEEKKWYRFFIWDATWHWAKAGLSISNLTRKFNEISTNPNFEEMASEINNSLKQDLNSWNFITTIFFELEKNEEKVIKFIWMWHEPMFIYRKQKKEIEKVIPWWLAAWIRIIKDFSSIKTKQIMLEDWDVLVTYTDWIPEAKSMFNNSFYSIDRIWEKLLEFASNDKLSAKEIYLNFLNDLKKFSWKSNYLDDVTILVLKRNKKKEVIENKDQILKILEKEWLNKNVKTRIKWKTFEEIEEDIKKIKNEKSIKNILKNIKILYKTWEMTKLKQECIKYIKEWFIHEKINFYLRKAIENENKFKIVQKEKKIQSKYNVLKELYKKWDYETVIAECSDIISKDWNI